MRSIMYFYKKGHQLIRVTTRFRTNIRQLLNCINQLKKDVAEISEQNTIYIGLISAGLACQNRHIFSQFYMFTDTAVCLANNNQIGRNARIF